MGARSKSAKSLLEGSIDAEALLTSHQVSELLQVNPSSVNNWVKNGKLSAFRTPGGHRRIRAADLAEFLTAHDMPIPRGMDFAVRRRLMLVDDDPHQLEAFSRLLRPYSRQVEVLPLTHGIDALLKVSSFRPHLIVLDVYMPGVDGLEVCRRLKANPDTADIKVIVASGGLTPAIRSLAAEAGVESCIDKPIDLNLILKALGLEGRVAVS